MDIKKAILRRGLHRQGIAVNLRGYGQSSVACGDSSFQKGAFFVTASRKPPLERGAEPSAASGGCSEAEAQ